MYNLLEYSSNYSDTTGSVCFYSKDEATSFNNDVANVNNFTSLKYKVKLLGKTLTQPAPSHANGTLTNATTSMTLKLPYHFSYISRSFKTPLINCKFEFKLRSTKHCLSSVLVNESDNANVHFNNIIFTIKDTKLYVLIVTLSAKDNQKLLKRLP